jgi:hypothetical protein
LVVNHEREDLTSEVTSELLCELLTDAKASWFKTNQGAIARLVPGMARTVQKLAKLCLPARIAEAEAKVEATLVQDLARLKLLMRVNQHIRPAELEEAQSHVDRVGSHIKSADVRLQSLRLIWRGKCEDGCPRLG